ncbi:unnamed protein product [Caenorhabditis sp. 36 PRJEB53466]|nr:unnamed protein product [Caenorhabditis sp. 36 PRJEB53466]
MTNYNLLGAKKIPHVQVSWKSAVTLDESLAGAALQVSYCPVPGCLGWGNILRHRNAFHRTEEACPVAAHMRKMRHTMAPNVQVQREAPAPVPLSAQLPAWLTARPAEQLPAPLSAQLPPPSTAPQLSPQPAPIPEPWSLPTLAQVYPCPLPL